jgi:hypothetical protein
MKRFLLGVWIGLPLGWLTVPVVKASYSVVQSDQPVSRSDFLDDDDVKASHAYKWYLQQMLLAMKQLDQHLQKIEENTRAVKEKLKA